MKALDLTGQRFGRLVVTELKSAGRNRIWTCICDCGGIQHSYIGDLRAGRVQSCGCIVRERAKLMGENNIRHGQSPRSGATRTWAAWRNMRRRCNDPGTIGYAHYGARGIKVCERWDNFENFLIDMGECPKGLTLDRQNNDKDYEPSNCRWATYGEQNRNRSTTRLITFNGKTKCLKDWAEHFGWTETLLYHRLKKASVELVFTEARPSRKRTG